MNKKKAIFLLLTLHSFMGWGQKVLQLQSPDKKTTLQISIDKDLSIGISQNGTVVLEPFGNRDEYPGNRNVGRSSQTQEN